MNTEEKLTHLVQIHECIYNVYSRTYSDKLCKQNAWELISKEMGISAAQCLNKWKRIRDNFRKAMKSQDKKSGSATSKERPVKHEMELDFLKYYIQDRDQITNLSSPVNTQSSDTTGNSVTQDIDSGDIAHDFHMLSPAPPSTNVPQSMPSTSTPPSRVSTFNSSSAVAPMTNVSDVLQRYLESKSREEKDPIDVFFLAMAANIKKLPQRLQLEVKQKVFSVVNDAELKWLNESTSADYNLYGGYYTDSFSLSSNYQPPTCISTLTPTTIATTTNKSTSISSTTTNKQAERNSESIAN